jgi:hypothetical protein
MPYRIVRTGTRRSFYGLLVAGAAASFLALGLTIASHLASNGQTADQALARADHAQIVAFEAKQRQETQHQAAWQVAWALCAQDNAHHTAAFLRINQKFARYRARTHIPALRRQLAASHAFTASIVDAIVPYQSHCAAVAAREARRR